MKGKWKNIIIRLFLPIIISIIILLMEGLNILTISWKKERAEVIQVTQVEYPIGTRWRGTLKGYVSNVIIKYSNHSAL
ncbi:hypothetical protein FACS189485_19060 [Spirochaetia bacterium]|nr:hypothetical protein FACS189485_19060 [Spirochaetia bacterium]